MNPTFEFDISFSPHPLFFILALKSIFSFSSSISQLPNQHAEVTNIESSIPKLSWILITYETYFYLFF